MTIALPVLDVQLERLDVAVFEVPLGESESDGTLEWDAVTCVVVEAHGGDRTGLGYTYGTRAVAELVQSELEGVVLDRPVLDVPATWRAMDRALRNAGRAGAGAMALAAVDGALWDLAARLLDLPLCKLLGQARESVPVYGSGGFTSYGPGRVAHQVGEWVDMGIPRVKMKVGRCPQDDAERIAAARRAIGPEPSLMVDAKGAYSRVDARRWAQRLTEWDVTWLEEPVSSEDVEGLREVRERAPAGMAIAAGEYAWTLADFHRLLERRAVDVLQADVTRCGGITPFRQLDALCQAHGVPLSIHCAPAASLHPACASDALVHLEWFHDHVHVESLLFDGAPQPEAGVLRPDPSRPGNGLELKRADAAKYEG
jgi:L-alanine-DL-glutamate epimerase-like enolase superfamily enzyme